MDRYSSIVGEDIRVDWLNADGEISMHHYTVHGRSRLNTDLHSFIYEGDAYMYDCIGSRLYVLPAGETCAIYKVSRRGNWKDAPAVMPICTYEARQVTQRSFHIYGGKRGSILLTMGVGNERSWHTEAYSSHSEIFYNPLHVSTRGDQLIVKRWTPVKAVYYIERGIHFHDVSWDDMRVNVRFVSDNIVCIRLSAVKDSICVTYRLINICDNTAYDICHHADVL